MYHHLTPAFPHWREGPVRVDDVKDGLSSTAAISEILHADGTLSRLRVNWNTPESFPEPDQLSAFAEYCTLIPDSPRESGWGGAFRMRGLPWTHGDIGYNLYNHVLTPNQPSCLNGVDMQRAIISSNSSHANGVNLLFADGHVQFVAEQIDSQLWHEMGSRADCDADLGL